MRKKTWQKLINYTTLSVLTFTFLFSKEGVAKTENIEKSTNEFRYEVEKNLDIEINSLVIETNEKKSEIENEKITPSKLGFSNPLKLMIPTSLFGSRSHPLTNIIADHGGIDLRAKRGTKVFSSKSGTVKFAGWSGNYGNLIIITHPEGFETRYAHLSKINVKKGEKILLNQQIALSGATGKVTGPHLHFEIRKNGKILNPTDLLLAFEK